MQTYLDSKPDNFDGIAVKRFLLGQTREQVSWYRQSISALDYVGCVACRRALETGQPFLEHYLPAFNFRDTERGTEYRRDPTFPILPELWARQDDRRRGLTMLVKLQTTDYLIYAELNKTERVTHLASKEQDPLADVLCDPLRDRATRGLSRSPGAWRMTGIPILLGFREHID